MGQSIEKFCQKLLDIHHPGRHAQEVISSLCPELYQQGTSDLELLSRWLYDSFAQIDLGRHQARKVHTPINRMLEELAYRLLSRWNKQGFVADSLKCCDLAKKLSKASDEATSILYKIEKQRQFTAISRQIESVLLDNEATRIKTYLLGEAPRLLNGQAGSEVRNLFFPPLESNERAFRFPWPEELKARIEAENRTINALDNRELGIRIMHAVRDNDLSNYDPTYPVYGVKSIYVLIPWAIDRLCNGTEVSDQALPSQISSLNDEMNQSLKSINTVLARYRRLTSEHDSTPGHG